MRAAGSRRASTAASSWSSARTPGPTAVKADYHNGPVLEPVADAKEKLYVLATYREEGTRKYIRLRRPELDQRFPGLIELVLQPDPAG